MNAAGSDDGLMARRCVVRIFRGIWYKYSHSKINLGTGTHVTWKQSYLSDILVAFLASHSQSGEAEDNTATKDGFFESLDTPTPIIFKAPVAFCGCFI
jgi:hypothetical protein